jgi:segregation and condensation protein B
MKAMKEYDDDKSDAEESALNDEGDQEFEESEELEEESIDDDEEDVSEDEDDEESETEEESEEDAIDIGSHIGLMLEDEEVYGTILEFDDDEGTVTIEEDGTGDLVTGYQDDMFLE